MPHTKPKFVTEELTGPEPTSQEEVQTQPQETELIQPTSESVMPKSPLAVTETNNIDNSLKFQEKGVFIKFFLVTFFATLLALTLAGGVYVYLTGTNVSIKSQANNKNTPSPEPTIEPIPSATPSNIDLSSYKISVLNGNGGIGVASAVKTIISKVGFKVTNLGNADNFNFTDTLIQVKPSVSADVVSKLKTSLDSNYSIKIGDQLDQASVYDIVITVGSK
jgi:hypothetical protein